MPCTCDIRPNRPIVLCSDCQAYTDRRNAVLPEAEKRANKIVYPSNPRWSAVFLGIVDEMMRATCR